VDTAGARLFIEAVITGILGDAAAAYRKIGRLRDG